MEMKNSKVISDICTEKIVRKKIRKKRKIHMSPGTLVQAQYVKKYQKF